MKRRGAARKRQGVADNAAVTRTQIVPNFDEDELLSLPAIRSYFEHAIWQAGLSAGWDKPQIRWVIDSIHVLKPIRFTNLRRNEVGSKATPPTSAAMKGETVPAIGILADDSKTRQQRVSTLLRDVAYITGSTRPTPTPSRALTSWGG